MRELHRFVGIPTTVCPVSGGDAHKQRQAIRPLAAHCIRHLEHQADAMVEAAPISVSAAIRKRRQKLMQQVAVSRMNLNEIEAGLESPERRMTKALDNGLDAGWIERSGHSVVRRKGDRAGRDRLPAALRGRYQDAPWNKGRSCAGLASGVRQLYAGARALRMEELRDAAEVRECARLSKCQDRPARCGLQAEQPKLQA